MTSSTPVTAAVYSRPRFGPLVPVRRNANGPVPNWGAAIFSTFIDVLLSPSVLSETFAQESTASA
jgi:hypothetical protein